MLQLRTQITQFGAVQTVSRPTGNVDHNGGYGRAPSPMVADVVVPTAEHVRFAAHYGVPAGLLRRV